MEGSPQSHGVDDAERVSAEYDQFERLLRLLAQYDYPPDKEARAVDLVIEQAELFAQEAG